MEQSELEALTVAQLTAYAHDQGIELTATDKAGMITEILGAYTDAASITPADADADEDSAITRAELEALTVPALKQLADSLGITLTATRKASIIDEILGGADSIAVPAAEEAAPETEG